MKNIKLLIIFTTIISSHIVNASFEQDKNYKSNCQELQNALAIAIDVRQNGITDVETVVPMQLPFSQEQLVTCRKNYEEQHPGIFQKNPAMIRGTNDGIILIRIFDRKEADDLMKQVNSK
jgi:hypothetical protein